MENDEIEEKLLTAECVLSELGYKTVRSLDALQVIIGEANIFLDEVRLSLNAEGFPSWGYVASMYIRGVFVGNLSRWLLI